MTSPEVYQFDRVSAGYYDTDDLIIDFEKDGEDRGGWPPDYFRSMTIREQFDDGSVEIGLKPIIGRDEYVGRISAETLDLLEPCFDMILEMPSGGGTVDGTE